MTSETISELLKPLIGKSGTVFLVVSRIGQIGFATNENYKLTGVEIRPDGLVRLERGDGWTVIDPAEVVAVAWNGDPEQSAGQFLLSDARDWSAAPARRDLFIPPVADISSRYTGNLLSAAARQCQ